MLFSLPLSDRLFLVMSPLPLTKLSKLSWNFFWRKNFFIFLICSIWQKRGVHFATWLALLTSTPMITSLREQLINMVSWFYHDYVWIGDIVTFTKLCHSPKRRLTMVGSGSRNIIFVLIMEIVGYRKWNGNDTTIFWPNDSTRFI